MKKDKVYYVKADSATEAYSKVKHILKKDDTEYSLTHEGTNYTIKNKSGKAIAVSTDKDKAMANLDNLNQGKPMTDEGEYRLVHKDKAYLIKKGTKVVAEYETKAEALRNLKALNIGKKCLDDSVELSPEMERLYRLIKEKIDKGDGDMISYFGGRHESISLSIWVYDLGVCDICFKQDNGLYSMEAEYECIPSKHYEDKDWNSFVDDLIRAKIPYILNETPNVEFKDYLIGHGIGDSEDVPMANLEGLYRLASKQSHTKVRKEKGGFVATSVDELHKTTYKIYCKYLSTFHQYYAQITWTRYDKSEQPLPITSKDWKDFVKQLNGHATICQTIFGEDNLDSLIK